MAELRSQILLYRVEPPKVQDEHEKALNRFEWWMTAIFVAAAILVAVSVAGVIYK